MPQETMAIEYVAEFSPEDYARISQGIIPKEMEDKWFVYLEGNVLCFHRSWTGACIYQVEFTTINGNYQVCRAQVNLNERQWGNTGDVYDEEYLHFLIGNMLLGKPIPFPKAKAATYRPWWKFWK